MKTSQTIALGLLIFGCAACASEPTKPTATKKQLTTQTTMTTAKVFNKMAYEQGALIALQMSRHMAKTHVLDTHPCKITTHRFTGSVEQPKDKTLAYTHEIKYNAQNLVSEITRTSPKTTVVYTFEYKGKLLTKTQRTTKRPDGAASVSTTTYAYNPKGELIASVVSRKGEPKYKLAFTYDDANKTVKAKTTAVKANKTVDTQITFDDQWRVKDNMGTTYEYSADKIAGRGKKTEYDVTLKDGRVQSFKSTYILGNGDTARRLTALLTATYKDKQLTQILSQPVPLQETSRFTQRDFEYTCSK